MNTAALIEVRELMGEECTLSLLADLATDLRRRFASPSTDDLAFDAHTTISSAGMLGFLDLAELCRKIEEACRAGADVMLLRGQLEDARRRTLGEIEALRLAA